MNYSIVIFVASFVIMAVAWYSGANKTYQPPEMHFLVGNSSMSDQSGHISGQEIHGEQEIVEHKV